MALVGSLVDDFDAQYGALFAELTRLCRALGAAGSAEDVAQEALIDARSHLGGLLLPIAQPVNEHDGDTLPLRQSGDGSRGVEA